MDKFLDSLVWVFLALGFIALTGFNIAAWYAIGDMASNLTIPGIIALCSAGLLFEAVLIAILGSLLDGI